MGEDLAVAQQRLEAERERLAVTIESLGDGLIVTEPDSITIRAVNPRATELIPELGPGGRTDRAICLRSKPHSMARRSSSTVDARWRSSPHSSAGDRTGLSGRSAT